MSKKVDIKDLKIPNLCFSLENDNSLGHKQQSDEWKEQRLERGFDDTETWNLDYTYAIYSAMEIFTDLSKQPLYLTEKLRYTIGVTCRLNKYQKFDFFYRIQTEHNGIRPSSDFIFGIRYAFTL